MSYLYMIVQVIVNLIYVPLLLSTIGTNEFGLYQLVGSVMAYLLIMNTTIAAAVQRYYNKHLAMHEYEQAENVLGVARIIYRVLSAISILVGVILVVVARYAYAESLTPDELNELSLMLCILIANVIIVLNNSIYTATIEAHERFTFQNGVQVAVTALQPVFIAIAVTIYPYAISVIIIQLISVIIEVLLRRSYSKNRLGIKVVVHDLDRDLIRGLLMFSGSILLATVADQIFWRTDQLILGYFFGTASVAVYGIATQIFMCYMPIGLAISNVFLPKAMRIFCGEDESETLSDLFVRIGRIQFLVLFAVLTGFIVFGDEFIFLWAGDGFFDAYLVAIIIMVPFTIDLIQNVGLTILRVNNTYGFRARVYFACAVINIVLTILFIQLWGILGAAFSTALSLLVCSGFVMNAFYWKRTGLDIPRFWREICRCAIAPFCFFVVVYALAQTVLPVAGSWLLLIVYLLAYVLLYVAVCWLFSFNRYEKDLLGQLAGTFTARIARR